MQVKVIIDEYKDTEVGRKVRRDDVIDVSEDHGKRLVDIGYAEVAQESYSPRRRKNAYEGEENA